MLNRKVLFFFDDQTYESSDSKDFEYIKRNGDLNLFMRRFFV